MSNLPVVVSKATLPAVVRRNGGVREPVEPSPAVRFQRLILQEAMELDASDIHVEPFADSTRIRFRIDGALREVSRIPRAMHESLVTRIKILAGLDITEKRASQDGHLVAEELPDVDFRISTLPTRWGEKIVARLLRRDRALLPLGRLGLNSALECRLRAIAHRSQGILLVVGPTGCGKTTTLYALINEIRGAPFNIVTIEDPVEYEMDSVVQVQLNERAGLTFSTALRSILRQDPDVILVGEIRDRETARTAFDAALSGHLVLSTLHATDAASAILRLAELGVDRYLIAAATLGVVAQRLVRLNCQHCAGPDYPPTFLFDRLGLDPARQQDLRVSSGCERCRFRATGGRAAIFELLEVDDRVRDQIVNGNETGIRLTARAGGLTPMIDQALSRAFAGEITLEEAYRSCYFG